MKLVLNYEPTAKGVPRTKFVNGTVITYYHKNTTEALGAIRALITNEHLKPFPEHTPIKMTVTFWRTKRKWLPKKETLPFRKPDLDNFLKWCIDGLSGIVFPDDAQVTSLIAQKRWSTKEQGYVEIKLEEDTDA